MGRIECVGLYVRIVRERLRTEAQWSHTLEPMGLEIWHLCMELRNYFVPNQCLNLSRMLAENVDFCLPERLSLSACETVLKVETQTRAYFMYCSCVNHAIENRP
jgi:hypothetical protein